MPLAEIEKSFMGKLLRPQENDDVFLAELLPLNAISEEKQLFIYRSNINGAHEKVLSQVYPACLNILGEDYFNQLCRNYRVEHPSTDPDLNNYGKNFSTFITKQLHLHNELIGLEYLPELALLEWQWHSNYYANNDAAFLFDDFALVDLGKQEKIVFMLGNSLSLFVTAYPLLEIWEANRNVINEVQEFIMPDNDTHFCISRVNYYPVVELLDKEDYALLMGMGNGLSLVQLAELNENADFHEQLVRFIQKGWVTHFFVPKLKFEQG